MALIKFPYKHLHSMHTPVHTEVGYTSWLREALLTDTPEPICPFTGCECVGAYNLNECGRCSVARYAFSVTPSTAGTGMTQAEATICQTANNLAAVECAKLLLNPSVAVCYSVHVKHHGTHSTLVLNMYGLCADDPQPVFACMTLDCKKLFADLLEECSTKYRVKYRVKYFVEDAFKTMGELIEYQLLSNMENSI